MVLLGNAIRIMALNHRVHRNEHTFEDDVRSNVQEGVHVTRQHTQSNLAIQSLVRLVQRWIAPRPFYISKYRRHLLPHSMHSTRRCRASCRQSKKLVQSALSIANHPVQEAIRPADAAEILRA